MIRRSLILLAAVVCLGCATTLPPAQVVAIQEPPPPPIPEPSGVVVKLSETEMSRLIASDPLPDDRFQETPERTIGRMTRQAVVSPYRADFRRGIAIFPYAPGALYNVLVGVEAPTDIFWPKGEELVTSGGLDKGWILHHALTGEGASIQSHLLVIPTEANLKGRLLLITTKGAYYLQVRSTLNVGLVAVTWHREDPPPPKASILMAGTYGVGYDIAVTSGQPEWLPQGVWDARAQGKTLIKFPATRQTHEAPVLYAIASDGSKQLINWRVKGSWYIADRQAPRWELRVGHEHGDVVSIARTAGYHLVNCPGSAECPPDGAP